MMDGNQQKYEFMFDKSLSRDKLEEILSTLRAELEKLLGEQLMGVYLYGSQARGDAQPDSDIDILIVLRDDFDYREMIHRTSLLVSDLSLEHDVVISRAFVAKNSFERDNTPFLLNVRREAFVIRPEKTGRSPLDVPGVDIGITAEEINEIIREGRERDI